MAMASSARPCSASAPTWGATVASSAAAAASSSLALRKAARGQAAAALALVEGRRKKAAWWLHGAPERRQQQQQQKMRCAGMEGRRAEGCRSEGRSSSGGRSEEEEGGEEGRGRISRRTAAAALVGWSLVGGAAAAAAEDGATLEGTLGRGGGGLKAAAADGATLEGTLGRGGGGLKAAAADGATLEGTLGRGGGLKEYYTTAADDGTTLDGTLGGGFKEYYGTAASASSYGGFGGNASKRDAAEYRYAVPAPWKERLISKVEKGTNGTDSEFYNPRRRAQKVYLTFLAGFSRLSSARDSVLSNLALSDVALQDVLASADRVSSSDRTDPATGQLFYEFEIESPASHSLISVTCANNKLYALFVNSPPADWASDAPLLRHIHDSFVTIQAPRT